MADLPLRAIPASGPIDLPVAGTLAPWQFTFIVVAIPGLLMVLLMMFTVREPMRRNLAATRKKSIPVREVAAVLWVNRGTFAVGGSMAADLVDEHALATGERREGMFFGVFGFCGKASPGIGIWLAGLALEWIDFTTHAAPEAVSELTVNRLVWVYGPTVFLFVLVTTLMMLRYRITKEALEEIQGKLTQGH